MAQGIHDAKERFSEVADEYCLLHECKRGELCLHARGKEDVSFEGIVSKIIDDEKDCFLKFKMTGELKCACKPRKNPVKRRKVTKNM